MYQKDYILRVIEQAGAMLRAMIGALREHRPEDARDTSREALTLLFGLPPTLTDSIAADGLITLLSVGGDFDAKRGRLAAEVFVRRVQADEMDGLIENVAADREKALRLIGATIEAGDAEDAAEARALLAQLETCVVCEIVPGTGEEAS